MGRESPAEVAHAAVTQRRRRYRYRRRRPEWPTWPLPPASAPRPTNRAHCPTRACDQGRGRGLARAAPFPTAGPRCRPRRGRPRHRARAVAVVSSAGALAAAAPPRRACNPRWRNRHTRGRRHTLPHRRHPCPAPLRAGPPQRVARQPGLPSLVMKSARFMGGTGWGRRGGGSRGGEGGAHPPAARNQQGLRPRGVGSGDGSDGGGGGRGRSARPRPDGGAGGYSGAAGGGVATPPAAPQN